MGIRPPRLSIGLPVYNGENFIALTLESILSQTFTDFELIISDNASTDATGAICQAYAARDERVHYSCNDRNLGAAPNYNHTFALARGEYFKWAAHDDWLAPTFLERCITALDQNPEAVLSYPYTQIIDADGNPLQDYEYNGRLRTGFACPADRFFDLVCLHQHCYPIFGVIRRSVLARTPLHGSYGHADGVLLAQLALMGKFHEIPEVLFFSRRHPHQATTRFIWSQVEPDYYGFARWTNIELDDRILLPRWRMLAEYCRVVGQAQISWRDRLACVGALLYWVKMFRRSMAAEVALAAHQIWQRAHLPQLWANEV